MNNLFNQAVDDNQCANLDSMRYEARLLLGVKISRRRDNGEVELFDTTRSSFYKAIEGDELDVYLKEGWNAGVLNSFSDRYERRQETLDRAIAREVAGNNRVRVTASIERNKEKLNARRIELMNKYGY